MQHVLSGHKRGSLLTVLLLICLVLIPLTLACEGAEEEAAIPTPAATDTATPAGTPAEAPATPGITEKEIVLGADAPLSGVMGAVYSMIPQATEAYFKYINDTQGGVCDRRIVYKVEDNGLDPAKAAEAVRKLVEQDDVFAIVGSLGDLPHAGVWDYLNENGVPDILVSAGAHKFGSDPQGHPWTIQMIPDYTIEGTFAGQYISQAWPGEKVGVLYENDDFGKDGLAGVKAGLDPDVNQLVSEQSYESTDISVRSQVANIKNAGAGVLVLYTTPGFTAQAIKEADRMGWHPQVYASYVNSDQIIFQFAPPELLEGMITGSAYKLAAWTDDPAIAEHHRIMQEYGGPSPTNFSVYAQSLAEVAVEALSKTCDNLTRGGLMEAIESIENFHSDLLLDEINITISDDDHTALRHGKQLVATVEDGKGGFEYTPGPVYYFPPPE